MNLLLSIKKIKILFVVYIIVFSILLTFPVSAAVKKFKSTDIENVDISKVYFAQNTLNNFQNIPSSEVHIKPAPVTPITKPVLGHKIPILMYHHIRDIDPTFDALAQNLSVSPSNFEKTMSFLRQNNYTSISFEDLNFYFEHPDKLPEKPVIISFDDGYENNFTNAFPILFKYSLKGEFAIITGKVGSVGYMNWDQIKMLRATGNDIVSHTVTHPDLPSVNIQQIIYELKESKKILDSYLHQNTKVIIYPSGKYSSEVISIARLLGYTVGRTTEQGKFISANLLMSLPTIRMFENYSIEAISNN